MKRFIAQLRLFLSQCSFEIERHYRKRDKDVGTALYEHKCGSCGKKIIEHDFGRSGTVQRWDIMKMYYDLNSCKVPDGYYVQSFANGWPRQQDYYLFDAKTHKRISLYKIMLRKKEQLFNCSFYILRSQSQKC